MRRLLSLGTLVLSTALAACDQPAPPGTALDSGTSTSDRDAGDPLPPVPEQDAGGKQPGEDGGEPPPPAPEIAIRFGGCEPVAACGGDVRGTWAYQDACIDDPFPAARGACPGITLENLAGTARGRVVATATTVTRESRVSLSGTIVVPASCAILGCSAIEDLLDTAYDSASCTGGPTGCRCDVSNTIDTVETSAYTITGSTLRAGDRTYEYCVDGNTLRHREVGDEPAEPGVYTLAR
ncbi:MAG TPA: hypothetical protein VIL20_06810 [Sandaracinaceae bacterium]